MNDTAHNTRQGEMNKINKPKVGAMVAGANHIDDAEENKDGEQ